MQDVKTDEQPTATMDWRIMIQDYQVLLEKRYKDFMGNDPKSSVQLTHPNNSKDYSNE